MGGGGGDKRSLGETGTDGGPRDSRLGGTDGVGAQWGLSRISGHRNHEVPSRSSEGYFVQVMPRG